jgi:hypothetical protein
MNPIFFTSTFTFFFLAFSLVPLRAASSMWETWRNFVAAVVQINGRNTSWFKDDMQDSILWFYLAKNRNSLKINFTEKINVFRFF